ncbi:hypothetical protein NE865_13493 [Phthorimaea operculella]|nr:hypothetical protein NE865_13493 [Phthorimaea operculella]
MGVAKYLLLFSVCTSFQYIANACTMEDVDDWRVTQDLSIIDVQRGTFWNKSTSEITSLTSITAGGGVNYANYLNVVWDSATNRFTISTSDGYEQYEENETSQTISFTVFFQCTGGSNSLIFDIAVQDTNNNPPTFMLQNQPTEQYEFTVTPPLPPGFLITGCGGDDIIVRDIDLTTSAIEFTIEDNPYFEIEYAGRSSSSPKEFLASLKTKDLIRSLSQDIELTVSATDVDGTGDPRITRTATIRVKADEAFLFPEEPVFTQPFYTATYENNLVALDSAISLRQGYDGEVIFSLDGEYSGNFRLVTNGNGMTIEVVNALPSEVFRSGQVLLVVKAEREYTSGATATVIVQLPEVLSLAFEQTQYEGRIVDNVLETLQVTLAQGYQDGFNVSLQNEYASYFSTSTQGNVVTLQMSPLEANIIDANNYISLQVIASNEFSSATAVVTLDIVKDDNTSPVFENAIYTGDYDQITGLTIGLSQGYDQTVNFSLSGDHAEYFSINNTGAVITLSSSGVPVELWPEEQLLLTISASKPRLVTATTTVVIRLPAARELAFAQPTYTGTIQDSDLTLQAIVLSVGHDGDVNFTLAGDYATYFTLSPTQNGVTVTLSTQLPDDVITGNSFLALTVLASGVHTTTASTVILLEIIKQDVNTPVFTELVYAGVYLGPNSIEIGNISLSQGYDGSVVFRLEGGKSILYY